MKLLPLLETNSSHLKIDSVGRIEFHWKGRPPDRCYIRFGDDSHPFLLVDRPRMVSAMLGPGLSSVWWTLALA